MSNCPRSSSFFRGCKFEPRYDEPAFDPFRSASLWSFEEITVNGVKQKPRPEPIKKYIRDVCVRCGKTIERGQP